MRCDDQGARRKPRHECVDHLVFRHFVEVRGRLVEQQHRGLPHHRARQQQRLTLSARQAETPFLNQLVQPLGPALHQAQAAAHAQGLEQLAIARHGATEQQVFANRSVEQVRALREQSDIAPHVGRVDQRQIDAVQTDHARRGFVHAGKQLQQGGLARTHAPQHGDFFARFDIQIGQFQGGTLRFFRVLKAHAGRAIRALQMWHMHTAAVFWNVHGSLHQFVQALTRHLRLLPARQQTGDLRHRRHHARGQNGTAHQRAGGHVAGHDLIATDQQHHCKHNPLQLLRPGHQHAGQKPLAHPNVGRHHVHVVPAVLKTWLGAQRFDVVEALHGFHQHGIAQRGLPHAGTRQPRQRPLCEQPRQDQQRQRRQRNPDHGATHEPQHAQEQEEER